MTTDPKQLVLAALVELLRKVDEGDIADLDYGICHNIEDMLWRGRTDNDTYAKGCAFFDKMAEEIWPRWPKHSGSSSYPIPEMRRFSGPSAKYNTGRENKASCVVSCCNSLSNN